MRYALNLGEDGRVLSVTYEKYATEEMPLVDSIPEDDVSDYRYVDCKFVKDPLPEPEQPEPPSGDSVWDELDAAYQRGVDSV